MAATITWSGSGRLYYEFSWDPHGPGRDTIIFEPGVATPVTSAELVAIFTRCQAQIAAGLLTLNPPMTPALVAEIAAGTVAPP
jgi:hypothetical protein